MYKFSLSNFRGRNNWENILHVNHFEDADRRGAFFDKNNTIFKIFTLGISLKVKKRTQNERVEDHHCKKNSFFFLLKQIKYHAYMLSPRILGIQKTFIGSPRHKPHSMGQNRIL